MANFDVFETGFDNFNETVNFGTRATDSDSLFEIVTLGVIRSSEKRLLQHQENSPLNILSYYQPNGRICLGCNNVLRIIKSIEEQDLQLCCEFNSCIDGICMSGDGNYIAICTSDGQVQIAMLPLENNSLDNTEDLITEFPAVFQEKFECTLAGDCSNTFIGIFSQPSLSNQCFYCLTKGGLVIKIKLVTSSPSISFHSEIIFNLKEVLEFCAFAYPFICVEGKTLKVLNLITRTFDDDDALGLTGLYSLRQNFLGRDKNDNIYIIEPLNCQIFEVNDVYSWLRDMYSSFVVHCNDSEKFFVGITKTNTLLAFLVSPKFSSGSKIIFNVPLEHPVHFSNVNGYSEDVIFVSDIYKNGTLFELRLHLVQSTEPETRVKKLIEKGDIDKAETFAKRFNVNQEVVAQAKASKLILKSACCTEDIDQLFNILQTVSDQSFRMMCCNVVSCQLASDTERVLSYGASVEIDVRDRGEDVNFTQLICKKNFNCLLRRFRTYLKICESFDDSEWRSFSECDIFKELLAFLRQGKMNNAVTVVLTLFSSENIFKSLDEDDITQVLYLLNLSTQGAVSFLNAFIPGILKYNPESIELFGNWVLEKIVQREGQMGFAESTISFLSDMIQLITSTHRCRSLEEPVVLQLNNLRIAVENIQLLMNNYSIRLTLADCLEGRLSIIKTLLQQNWLPDKLESVMKDFVFPFLSKCRADSDQVLACQIREFLRYEEKSWVDTAYVLIKLISSEGLRLDLITDILIFTSKPWTAEVKKIAMLGVTEKSESAEVKRIKELLKEEPILAVLQKYKIDPQQFKIEGDKYHYMNRILYVNNSDRETAFDDIRLIFSHDQLSADYYVMKEIIAKGEKEQALNILDKLDSQYVGQLSRLVLEHLYSVCTSYYKTKDTKHYQEALKHFYNRSLKHASKRERERLTYQYRRANGSCDVYFKYHLSLSFGQFSAKQRLNLLLEKIAEVMEEDEYPTFSKLVGHCNIVSSFLDEPLDKILSKCLAVNHNHFELLVEMGHHLLEESSNSDLLVECAWSILNFSVREQGDSGEDTFLGSIQPACTSENLNLKIENLLLAKKLCVKALVCFEEEDGLSLSSILDVMRFFDSTFYLDHLEREQEILTLGKLHNVYIPMKIPGLYTDSIRVMINMYRALDAFVGNAQMISNESQRVPVQIEDEVNIFLHHLETLLLDSQQILSCVRLLKTIQRKCLNDSRSHALILKSLETFFVKTVWPKAVEVVIGHQYVDSELLLELMLLYPRDKIETCLGSYFKLYKRQPNRLQFFAEAGLKLIGLGILSSGKHDLLDVYNLCKYWFKLEHKNMRYELYFPCTPEVRFENLVNKGILKIDHLPEFCADFRLDLQTCYLKYLKGIILNWRPHVEFETDIGGRRNVIIKNSERELLEACSNAVAQITDKKTVNQLIADAWPLVNPYYYEVFEVLLNLQQLHCNSDAIIESEHIYRIIIHFLKSYRRVSAPAPSESEQWFAGQKCRLLIDSLSEFRLPLSPRFLTSDIWNIIKSEVTLDTYEDWLQLSRLGLEHFSAVDICSYAIHSVSSGDFLSPSSNKSWDLCVRAEHLISRVDKCASSIHNLERATAAVYSLMCKMPPGADKLQIAELSFKYAGMLRKEQTNDAAEKVYKKVKQRYLNCAATHILYKYDLSDIKYLEATNDLSQLLWNLYNDPRIESYRGDISFPDINKAVEELCELFHEDPNAEKQKVLLQFLSCETPLVLDSRKSLVREDCGHLKRALYICSGENEDYWQHYLIEQTTDPSKTNLLSCRANAFICISLFGDHTIIGQMMNIDPVKFVDYVDKTCVVAQMNCIGILCESVEALDGMHKKKLLKQLAIVHNPERLKCIAVICRIYNYNDMKYWEFIINNSLQLKMYVDTRDYLEYLCDRCQSETVKKAWEVVLNHSFDICNWAALTERDVFLLLRDCPVLELDLEPLIEKCFTFNRGDVADILRKFSLPRYHLKKEETNQDKKTEITGDCVSKVRYTSEA